MDDLKELAKNILETTFVLDAHFDLLYDVVNQRNLGNHRVMEKDHLGNFKQGGLNIVVSSLFINNSLVPEISLRQALDQISALYQELKESSEYFMLCKNYDDIIKAEQCNKIGIMLSFEGVEPLYNDLELLEIFYQLGVRLVGLTWSRRNYAGDPSKFLHPDEIKNSNGLSDFGKELVNKAQNMKMIVDVSHLNDKGFWDVIELAKQPVIASHSNCRKIVNFERNLDDSQIKAIASTGGVIGINGLSRLASDDNEAATVKDLVQNIEHIVDLVGINHVGLGLDFCDHLKKFNSNFINQHKTNETFDILGNHSNIFILVEELLKRGYTVKDISKILGENFLRIYNVILH
ncbi:dipeptidase [Petrotoga sp. 9PWA.NaAc.5.4]|uniref:dipeptidase n=1 Tax=Petrotoga sp. 9PWA.NaAc.5.4 TaxID=1434328 RepID=UPI000CA6AD84|nr:dipeptidase [Petrotoga sp. 9PWA.NaAc.5.4]PNR93667.1 membrane dipeptidase [Petrotoga sp. 9PWA.NaAc.5.4]